MLGGGQVVRSDWVLGTCEQDEQVDKKGKQPERSGLGEGFPETS